MTTSSRAKELLAELETIISTSGDAARDSVTNELQKMLVAAERPRDTLYRVLFVNLQLPIVKTACDLNLFELLCEQSSWSSEDLAAKVDASPILLHRILCYLAARSFIHEAGPGVFSANNITRTMALEGSRKAVNHFIRWNSPAYDHLPVFFKERKYQNPTDLYDCPFQPAHQTKKAAFEKFAQRSEWIDNFAGYMTVQRLGAPSWLDVYPWKEEIREVHPEQVLFVDIGGGVGHQAVAFREQIGDIPNKVIVQDLPDTVAGAIRHPGVEPMAQDFFTEQHIKGAKIYYVRNIIHDFPDDQATQILKRTAAACTPDSVILIDDIVLPVTGATWQAMQLDLTMMMCLGGMERNVAQFEALLSRAGLRIVEIYKYDQAMQDSVIKCVPIQSRLA